ncbi:MAG: winged helix-turn-helix domain-containing protein [Candidatus Thorarchaeota archaeon]
MVEISRDIAQKFIITIQGLAENANCQNTLEVVNKIHNIQIDTISVVARAQDITIFNRFQGYQEKEVWKWLKEKKLFEYWSHALCFLPIETYPFYAWRMKQTKENNSTGWKKWISENRSVINKVYDYIKKNGPTMSADFKNKDEIEKRTGWWDWKKEKIALEHLYEIGELAITERNGFQKVYDLTERVLPPGISSEPMSEEELPDFMVQTIFPALGIAGADEMKSYLGAIFARYLWKSNKKSIEKYLDECVKEDILLEIQIKDFETKLYTHKNLENKLLKINPNNTNNSMRILSPFDNIIRERNYPSLIWNFDYKIDSYLPKDQRVYGYHVLVLLDDHSLVGRVDAKAYRKEKIMEFKSIFLESHFYKKDNSFERLILCLKKFSDFHNCVEIRFGEKVTKDLKAQFIGNL